MNIALFQAMSSHAFEKRSDFNVSTETSQRFVSGGKSRSINEIQFIERHDTSFIAFIDNVELSERAFKKWVIRTLAKIFVDSRNETTKNARCPQLKLEDIFKSEYALKQFLENFVFITNNQYSRKEFSVSVFLPSLTLDSFLKGVDLGDVGQ